MLRPLTWIVFLIIGLSGAMSLAQNSHTGNEITPADNHYFDENFTLTDDAKLQRSATSEAYHRDIKAILANKDFAQRKTVTQWRWKDANDKSSRKEKFPEWIINIIEFFEQYSGSFKTFAQLIEIILWALVVSLCVYFIYRYRNTLRNITFRRDSTKALDILPTTLLGLDVKRDSLPDDIPAAALALWQQAEHRQAIALLLRASLIRLIHDHEIRLFDSDTESECCDRIDQQAPPEKGLYMRQLVTVWQSIAYAHQPPNKATFVSLCQQWSEVFNAK